MPCTHATTTGVWHRFACSCLAAKDKQGRCKHVVAFMFKLALIIKVSKQITLITLITLFFPASIRVKTP